MDRSAMPGTGADGVAGRSVTRWATEASLLLGGLVLAFWLGTEYVALPWAVAGASMSPTLEQGDRVLVDRWSYRHRPPRPGEVALFRGPEEIALVKRVRSERAGAAFRPELWGGAPAAGAVRVFGDNPSKSADSRTFGPVPVERFLGRVVWRIWPPRRFGPVR